MPKPFVLIAWLCWLSCSDTALSQVQIFGSTNDAWDIRSGVVITGYSSKATSTNVPECAIGGIGGPEGETFAFATFSHSTVEWLQWRSPMQLSIGRLRVYGSSDNGLPDGFRSFARFCLLARSAVSGVFDTVVCDLQGPFPYGDANGFLLIDCALPVTIQAAEWRAEFTANNGGPRVIEIDGYTNRCMPDLNGDGQTDDHDFVLCAYAYNALDCGAPTMVAGCPSDFNRDGIVDDADFVLFVTEYNLLLCP